MRAHLIGSPIRHSLGSLARPAHSTGRFFVFRNLVDHTGAVTRVSVRQHGYKSQQSAERAAQQWNSRIRNAQALVLEI